MTIIDKLLFLFFWAALPTTIGFAMLYYVVKAAVKNGIKEALYERETAATKRIEE